MDAASSASGLDISRTSEAVLAAVGIHPWNAEKAGKDSLDTLRHLARENRVVALGEAGLDFVGNVFSGVTYHDHPALREGQERVLRGQVEIALELGLPLILHARGAYPALLRVLKETKADRVSGVVHNFDTEPKLAHALFDLGFSASFGGAITYPDASRLHALVREVPLAGILLETDSPYMPLCPQATEKNEPANVARVAQRIADLKGLEVDVVVEASFRNFAELFRTRVPG
jgi:TatD DNase family protein